jgi:hypothetical protein
VWTRGLQFVELLGRLYLRARVDPEAQYDISVSEREPAAGEHAVA